MRALGIDLGSKRIGVAVSDPTGMIASPLEVVTRSGQSAGDHRRLLRLAEEWEVDRIVVGLPLSMDGSEGPAARAALEEIEQLRRVSAVPVATYDERLTTVTAERHLTEMGLDGRQRRGVIDKLAAAVMLQAWLDGQSS